MTVPLSQRPGLGLAELRRRIERSPGLPLRPASARWVLEACGAEPGLASPPANSPRPSARWLEFDPGWVLAVGDRCDADSWLEAVAERPWWPALSGRAAEAVERLWRHGVAASCLARRLAREAGRSDPAALGRRGLLHGLGYWALAAADPERLAELLAIPDRRRRRAQERAWLGTDAAELGRTLAERWGAEAGLAEAAWLHAEADRGLAPLAADAGGLELIRQAHAWAERTPWALAPSDPPLTVGTDPRLRRLIADVQARCGSAFVDPAATGREERLVRSHARLQRRVAELVRAQDARDRLIVALAESDPADDPGRWAQRAEGAWAPAVGVAEARLDWLEPVVPAHPGGLATLPTGAEPPSSVAVGSPGQVVPLGRPGRPVVALHLWHEPGRSVGSPAVPIDAKLAAAWGSWAALVADRARLAGRLGAAVEVHRAAVEDEAHDRLADRLDALAQFAAGAGHELNNPLAVILGRAQLLLSGRRDPDAARSLRAIIAQAQRAHRIIRDLMYVARPPRPRPRSCQPDEIVRGCLRDLQDEAEARGVRLVAELPEAGPRAWADPDPLRHLAEVFLRNALEATPPGGTLRVRAEGGPDHIAWTFHDTGRGLSTEDLQRLFDPFFCGRQAGRGLGLGLPRAARFLAQCGGRLRWRSAPGRGTVFHVTLPLESPPGPSDNEGEATPACPAEPRAVRSA